MENTVSLTKSHNNLNRLMEDYNKCKLDYESAPKAKVEKGKKFDNVGYQISEAARVKWDLALARVVEVKQADVTFLTVRKDGITTIMVYNPFGKYLDDLEDMTYEEIEVADKKSRAYTKAANGSIKWMRKIMTGDINSLFVFKLRKWFEGEEKNIKQEFEDFCKDVSSIIRYNPHKDMVVFEDYIHAFFKWYQDLESDDITIMEVYKKVMENLQMCFYADTREKLIENGTINDEIRLFSQKIFVQDCSKACHAHFIKLRVGMEDKKTFLDGIITRGSEKQEAQKKKFGIKKPPLKNAPLKQIKNNDNTNGTLTDETFEEAAVQDLIENDIKTVVSDNKKRGRTPVGQKSEEEEKDGSENDERAHKKQKLS